MPATEKTPEIYVSCPLPPNFQHFIRHSAISMAEANLCLPDDVVWIILNVPGCWTFPLPPTRTWEGHHFLVPSFSRPVWTHFTWQKVPENWFYMSGDAPEHSDLNILCMTPRSKRCHSENRSTWLPKAQPPCGFRAQVTRWNLRIGEAHHFDHVHPFTRTTWIYMVLCMMTILSPHICLTSFEHKSVLQMWRRCRLLDPCGCLGSFSQCHAMACPWVCQKFENHCNIMQSSKVLIHDDPLFSRHVRWILNHGSPRRRFPSWASQVLAACCRHLHPVCMYGACFNKTVLFKGSFVDVHLIWF